MSSSTQTAPTAPARGGGLWPVNTTVIGLTARVLLGRRRGLMFLVLPLVLVGLAATLRWAGADEQGAVVFLASFAMGTLLPLVAVLAGTGVIGPEIDDGSIVYVLAKPVPRWHVVVSKIVVAVGVVLVAGALPVVVSAVLLTGSLDGVALGYGVGAAVGAVAYCALFVLLGVISRHAVVIGLVYALVWESLIGGFVPGVRTLSVQQWSLAVSREVGGIDISGATVPIGVAFVALVVVTAAATWYASRRLRSLSLSGET